jgi:putative sigma-54 modulation protein
MKLQMQSVHFDADKKLLDFIQKKVDKLETFYDRFIDGEVIMSLLNETPENKFVDIKLNVPGSQLFATGKATSFEAAVDIAVEGLKKQVTKYKEKLYSH